MAERIDKQILETVFKTTIEGDSAGVTANITKLKSEVQAASGDVIKLVEAEKKLEVEGNKAGVAVSTQTKKMGEFQKATEGTAKAMAQLTSRDAIKKAFDPTTFDGAIARLKVFTKQLVQTAASGGDVDRVQKKMESFVNSLKGDVKIKVTEQLKKDSQQLNTLLENPVRRLRELTRLINTSSDPKLIKELQIEAGKLKDELGDTQELIRALASDTFFADTAVQGLETATGAFTAFQGIAALATEDTEAFAKAAQKAQSALALLQGVQTVLNNLKKEDNIITRLQIVGQRVYAAVVGQSTGAMKGFKLALAATGIGILIIALAALITNFDKIKAVLGLGVNPATEKYIALTERAVVAANRQRDAVDGLSAVLRAEADAKKLANKDLVAADQERLRDEEIILKAEQEARDKQTKALADNVQAQIKKLNELRAVQLKQGRAEVLEGSPVPGASLIGSLFKTALPSGEDVKEQQKIVDDLLLTQTKLAEESIKNASELKSIELDRTAIIREQSKLRGDDRLKELAEIERHALAIAGLERASEEELLQIRIDAQQKRIAIQRNAPVDPRDQEAVRQQVATIRNSINILNELETELSKLREGTIDTLSRKASKLSDSITKDLVPGTEEFNNKVKELIRIQRDLTLATRELAGPLEDGSAAMLQNKISDLEELIQKIGPDSPILKDMADRLKAARIELDSINKLTSGTRDPELLDEKERNLTALEGLSRNSEIRILGLQIQFAEERLKSTREFYAADSIEVINGENMIAELKKAKAVEEKKRRDDVLDEERRHQAALYDIEGKSEVRKMQQQLRFAIEKRDALRLEGHATAAELLRADNEIAELEKALRKARFLKQLEDTKLIIGLAGQAASAELSILMSENDKLISLQQKRVDDVAKIAERGNAKLLQLEQDRLDELNKKREAFVKKQQALAIIELIANSLIAVSKAAAEGGAAAVFTVAATLAALGVGLVQARAQASAAGSFKKGGLYDNKGGFTGYGPPDGQSLQQGPRPYEYHNMEYIMPASVTTLGDNMKWFEKIRLNKIDIGQMMGQKSTVHVVDQTSNMKELVSAVRESKGVTIINKLNSKGIISIMEQDIERKRRIEHLRS